MSRSMPVQSALFENHEIRRVYDEDSETWWFSVVDIIQVLTRQADYQTARKYRNKMKERLGKEGSQSVTNSNRLKLPVADGKTYLTDVATADYVLVYRNRKLAGVEAPHGIVQGALAHLTSSFGMGSDSCANLAGK